MLKYKYVIETEFFSEMEAFQKYLNRKGAEGYELIQWQLVNASFITCNSMIQPFSNTLPIIITWKIEDHDS